MEENQNYDIDQEVAEYDEEEEVGFSDRLIGVLTEPAAMFGRLAKGQTKVTDWVIPLLLVIASVILIQVVVMTNPVLQQQAVTKQMDAIEKRFDAAVEGGQMTREAADNQIETIRDNMASQMAAGLVIQIVATMIIMVIMFFIVASYFILMSKFVLKGEGTYAEGLSVVGLVGYITVLQIVVSAILIMVSESINMGPNLAKILGMDVQSLNGYLLSYIDPFSIWYYFVLGIGLSKIYKSESSGKFIGLAYGSWIVIGIAFFFLTEAVPLLKSFIQ